MSKFEALLEILDAIGGVAVSVRRKNGSYFLLVENLIGDGNLCAFGASGPSVESSAGVLLSRLRQYNGRIEHAPNGISQPQRVKIPPFIFIRVDE